MKRWYYNCLETTESIKHCNCTTGWEIMFLITYRYIEFSTSFIII